MTSQGFQWARLLAALAAAVTLVAAVFAAIHVHSKSSTVLAGSRTQAPAPATSVQPGPKGGLGPIKADPCALLGSDEAAPVLAASNLIQKATQGMEGATSCSWGQIGKGSVTITLVSAGLCQGERGVLGLPRDRSRDVAEGAFYGPGDHGSQTVDVVTPQGCFDIDAFSYGPTASKDVVRSLAEKVAARLNGSAALVPPTTGATTTTTNPCTTTTKASFRLPSVALSSAIRAGPGVPALAHGCGTTSVSPPHS
jgi:hypothetical protein